MTVSSAPGKVILLGEHAVVFGLPAIAVAVSLRMHCMLRPSGQLTVNGIPVDEHCSPYVVRAIKDNWEGGPLNIDISSEIPAGSGLGSSAAVTVAILGALAAMKGRISEEYVARRAFEVESKVQGRASPTDTSVAAHGSGIFINSHLGEDLLWEISSDTRRWFVHHCRVPEMSLVIGYTGIKAPTGPLVAKVKRYVDHTRFARDVVDEIGSLTLEGASCLRKGDLEGLGRAMTRDHDMLAILGVSTPALQKMVDAALPYSYGAKLTGAGGGGSMIALTDDPLKVAAAIRSRGGHPFIVRAGVEGVRTEG